ncbi:MAG: glycosyltransferase [Ignavibacteriaceae bacterium]|jgi:glycosyltransferase involved in cell wall biosynthesis|nr:glycosyltransferase [Ignavibacteriaceae bacterium]
MNYNKKVLLLQATISLYNVPVYNIIAKNVELTVAFTTNNECKEAVSFKIIKLKYKKILGLFIIYGDFYKFCSQYDVVIFMPDLHYLSYCSLPFTRRKYKVIAWTIGIRASYTRRYNVNRKKDLVDKLYGKILNKSDAIIFYMKTPIEYWGNSINRDKVFIAHNTVEVLPIKIDKDQEKNTILFVGTLYKEKKIYELINAFIEAKSNCNTDKFLSMDIIGKGEEYANIKKIIQQRGLSDSIFLRGPIYDEDELSKYFSRSLLCISPDQAGLSVLKSMGYGVPYVSKTNAFTGGERFNIIDKENGLLYNTHEELVFIIQDAYKNPEKYIALGINASEYYNSNTTIKHMANGFIDAINYVLT